MRFLFGSFLVARYALALRKFVLVGPGLTFSLRSSIACLFIIFVTPGPAIDNSAARCVVASTCLSVQPAALR